MMKKLILSIAPAVALLWTTVGATPLQADAPGPFPLSAAAFRMEEGPTVRVTNNHGLHVTVFVVGSGNRRHRLGTVDDSAIKELHIPADLIPGNGAVRLKIYPILPEPGLGVTGFAAAGIKTKELAVRADQVIELHLQPDLTRSVVGIVSG